MHNIMSALTEAMDTKEVIAKEAMSKVVMEAEIVAPEVFEVLA